MEGATDKVPIVTVVLTQDVVLHEPSALTQYVVVTVGLCVIEAPELIKFTPQDPVYHFQSDPSPDNPPIIKIVDDEPEHIEEGDAKAEEAEIEVEFTTIVVLTHAVVLQNPSAVTQYVVVAVGL